MSGDDSVTEERPEKCRNGTCMECGEDDKGRGSLLEKRAGGEKLEGEGEEINGEESTDLDTTWGDVRIPKGGGQEKGNMPTAAFR